MRSFLLGRGYPHDVAADYDFTAAALGKGASATVHAAVERTTGRRVAIKSIGKARLAALEPEWRDVRREVQVCAHVNSASRRRAWMHVTPWLVVLTAMCCPCAITQVLYHLAGHPNVLQLHGAYEDDTHVHLVTELCAGGSALEHIVQKVTQHSGRSCLPGSHEGCPTPCAQKADRAAL